MKLICALLMFLSVAAHAIDQKVEDKADAKSADEIKSGRTSCFNANQSRYSRLACDLAAVRFVRDSTVAANQEIIQADRLEDARGRKIPNLTQYVSEETMKFQTYVDSRCRVESEMNKKTNAMESQRAALECEFSYKIERLQFLEREALN